MPTPLDHLDEHRLARDLDLAEQAVDHADDLRVDDDLRQVERVHGVDHADAAADQVGLGGGRGEPLQRLLLAGLLPGYLASVARPGTVAGKPR